MKSVLAMLIAAPIFAGQTAPVAAQQAERARQLLESPQWREKAWGVYLAARLHSEDLNRRLDDEFLPAAALRNATYSSDEHAYLSVLLDAAIEARVRVPAAQLEPFAERWAAAVLILLARDPESDQALLRMRAETSPPLVWLAANNLLFERKSQPWFAAILGEVHIAHRFVVVDRAAAMGAGGEGGAVCGDGITAIPKGFPPVALYDLSDRGERESVLLARGPRDVFYHRTVVATDRQSGTGSCSELLDRESMRLAYLAALGDGPVGPLNGSSQIVFTTQKAFVEEASRRLDEQESAIVALLERIALRGLSAPDVPLRIVPEVVDRRASAAAALPHIGERPIAHR